MIRVMVVDDNTSVRRAARLLLEDAGFEVVEATGGAQALQAFQEARADLVICDIFMPDLDGLEVLRKLRAISPAVKVIAMSGGGFGGSMDMLPTARRLGAVSFLYKPFTQKSLLIAIAEARGTSADAGEGAA